MSLLIFCILNGRRLVATRDLLLPPGRPWKLGYAARPHPMSGSPPSRTFLWDSHSTAPSSPIVGIGLACPSLSQSISYLLGRRPIHHGANLKHCSHIPGGKIPCYAFVLAAETVIVNLRLASLSLPGSWTTSNLLHHPPPPFLRKTCRGHPNAINGVGKVRKRLPKGSEKGRK